jgi:SAM-dependent methyltransferase
MARRNITRRALRSIPKPIRQFAKRAILPLERIAYYGTGRFCPICERESRRFKAFGVVPRPEARCIHCGALDRQRFIWLYLDRMTDLFHNSSRLMVHFAPSLPMEEQLRSCIGPGYVTIDLFRPKVMVRADITAIPYPEDSVDLVCCSHVLEHVPDDKRAMRELFRILKPRGRALVQVPITDAETIEDPSITDPNERLRLFGQIDHVRVYGLDLVARLEVAGFEVEIVSPSDFLNDDEITRTGIRDAGDIYLCIKPCRSLKARLTNLDLAAALSSALTA